MRLYYFTKAAHALDNVSKRRIKISLYRDVNDPWELLPFDLSDAANREIMLAFKNRMDTEYAFICMSKTWTCPLMWAHYAEKHRGVALGFDVADDYCNPIHYLPSVYELPPRRTNENMGTLILRDGRCVFNALFFTKFDQWAYEKEVRVHTNQNGTHVNEAGIEFSPFSAQFDLREIVLGEQCVLTADEFHIRVPDLNPNLRFLRARRARHDFCMEPDSNGT